MSLNVAYLSSTFTWLKRSGVFTSSPFTIFSILLSSLGVVSGFGGVGVVGGDVGGLVGVGLARGTASKADGEPPIGGRL